MKIKFRRLDQIERFCKLASEYHGDVIVSEGSIHIDGESMVGLITLGLNKQLNVQIANENSDEGRIFKMEIDKLGIRKE